MNLLQAYQFLNMINEGMEDYQENYKNYVLEHKERVKQFADWLVENLPELFREGADIETFYEIIEEHDGSKFSEEEFEPYAQKWFNNSGKTPEYEEAWKHHWMNNEHHPEYWLGEDMPYIYILEMLCDWGSFSIASGNMRELSDFYYNKAKNDEEKNLSDNTKKIIEEILDKIKAANERESLEEDNSPSLDYLKQKQLEIILKTNPAHDDIHTWIRDIDDILTFEETMKVNKYPGEDFDPSYSYAMAEAALMNGKIKVYSSYPITPGTFVTPSKLEAESYAGSKNIYSKEVELLEVAWIDPMQGIFTSRV